MVSGMAHRRPGGPCDTARASSRYPAAGTTNATVSLRLFGHGRPDGRRPGRGRVPRGGHVGRARAGRHDDAPRPACPALPARGPADRPHRGRRGGDRCRMGGCPARAAPSPVRWLDGPSGRRRRRPAADGRRPARDPTDAPGRRRPGGRRGARAHPCERGRLVDRSVRVRPRGRVARAAESRWPGRLDRADCAAARWC